MGAWTLMGLARFESLSPPAIQVKPAIPSNYSPKAKMFNSKLQNLEKHTCRTLKKKPFNEPLKTTDKPLFSTEPQQTVNSELNS